MTTPIQDAVLEYQARGWRPIRIHARGGEWEGKEPIGKAWQNTKPGSAKFLVGENIGVLLGPPSSNLVDVDLDAELARMIASLPDLFGNCPAFGREGLTYPGHRLLYCPDLGDNAKRHQFSPAGDFIDVRAGGCQSVFPPSEHAAKIVWSGRSMPIEIPTMNWEELRKRAKLVAFLSTCLKFYTGAGEHDDYVMAVAGALANWNVDPELGSRLIKGLCEFAGDTHEIATRMAKAQAAVNKLAAGGKVTGFTYLSETYFTEEFTKKFQAYLAPVEQHAKTDPNAIRVDDPNVSTYTDEVAARIMELDPYLMFQRAGDLVRIRQVDTLEQINEDVQIHPGTTELVPVQEPWLDYQVTKMGMQFFGYSSRGKRVDSPPKDLGKRIIQVKADLPFHPIIGISKTPILSCSEPGYDAQSKLYLAFPAGLFPTGESHPSKAMAEAALKRILHPFRLFPFVDGGLKSASASVTASAMISGVIRAQMKTCPLHGGNAPVAGTGKTLWAQMISAVVTGQAITNVINYNPKEDEFRKCMFSLFLRGANNILIDNVNSTLYSPFLNMALTSSVISDRVLGISSAPSVSTRALILATGNNLSANEEIQRRMVTSTMDANVEHPAEREFPFEPLGKILENRPQMVADCLTILRAYIAQDCPNKPSDLGMFEDWTIVRGALMWLEMPDPLLTQHTGLIVDPTRDARREVLENLWKWREKEPFTIAEIGRLMDDDSVRQAFESAMRKGWSAGGAGKLLGKYVGHWTGDLCIRRGAVEHQAATWRVERRGEDAAKQALIVPEQHEFGAAYARAGAGK